MPLRQYIEHLYLKRFGKRRPDVVLSIEEKIRLDEKKKAKRRKAKIQARQDYSEQPNQSGGPDEPTP